MRPRGNAKFCRFSGTKHWKKKWRKCSAMIVIGGVGLARGRQRYQVSWTMSHCGIYEKGLALIYDKARLGNWTTSSRTWLATFDCRVGLCPGEGMVDTFARRLHSILGHLCRRRSRLMSIDKGCVDAPGGQLRCARSCLLGQISMRKQLKISIAIVKSVVPVCGHFDGTVLFSFVIYSRRD